MKPEIAKRWVEALRSDKYQQGRGCLRSNLGFCCLGVLCDIVQAAVGGRWVQIDSDEDDTVSMHGFCTEDQPPIDDALPEIVRQFVGMKSVLGGFNKDGKLLTLSLVNDSGAYDFDKIADIIEEHAAVL